MARNVVSICNAALDELPADTIQSIDDAASVGARACKRHYANVIADLMGEHDYEAAIRRDTLAEATNDRSYEWGYAYAEPTSIASILRVMPQRAPLDPSSVVVLPGQRAYPFEWPLQAENVGVPFVRANGKIYTNDPSAVLEYVTAEPDLARMSPLFCRALELELAARICMPVIKDKARKRELVAEAEAARSRAIADDKNNTPERWDTVPSEEALIRAGVPIQPRPWYAGGNT